MLLLVKSWIPASPDCCLHVFPRWLSWMQDREVHTFAMDWFVDRPMILDIRTVSFSYEQHQLLQLPKKRPESHWPQVLTSTIRTGSLTHQVPQLKICQFWLAMWRSFRSRQAEWCHSRLKRLLRLLFQDKSSYLHPSIKVLRISRSRHLKGLLPWRCPKKSEHQLLQWDVLLSQRFGEPWCLLF